MSVHALPSVSCNNLPTLSEHFIATCKQSSKSVSFDTWHKRIGHIPAQIMKLLPLDITILTESELIPCDICPRAKQQRLPFQLSTISTCVPF